MRAARNPRIVTPITAAVGAALVASRFSVAHAVAAAAAWPVVEYCAHRFAMHGARRFGARTYRRVHGAHHDRPRDPSHYPVPPVVTLSVGGAIAVLSPSFAGALLMCLAAYDVVHLGCHGLGPLRGRLPRAIVAHHAGHHADGATNFSVTAPVLDRLLGTVRA